METIIRRLTGRGKLCILNMSPWAKVNSNTIPRGFSPWDWIGTWTFALGILVRIFQSMTYFFNGSPPIFALAASLLVQKITKKSNYLRLSTKIGP